MDKATITEVIELERYIAEKIDRLDWQLRKRKSAKDKAVMKQHHKELTDKWDKLNAIVETRIDTVIKMHHRTRRELMP